MRAKFVIIILVILMLSPLSVKAELTSPLDKLNEVSDEALQMVKLQRYDDAKRLLEYFSAQFLASARKENSFTMDELRIVSVAHKEALEAATSSAMNYEERVNRVTKFRLVVDAVSSTQQPLWTEMEGPVMAAFTNAKEAAYSGNNEDFNFSLNSFLSLYKVIYPSMKLDISPDTIEKINARVDFIDSYRPQVLSQSSSQQELEALQVDLQNIFDGLTEDETDPSLWWVIISTGSIIIITLSYVGWRKYSGDREKERNRSREHKD